MVCEQEARSEIAQELGEHATRVSHPTWERHLYSCTYHYPQGSVVLSVKELSSRSQTQRYVDALASSLGATTPLDGIGQHAFEVRNGSVVVQKDYKVLLVNTTGIHAPFTSGATGNINVAQTVASVIMACWSGS
jgi:hypothetical protein